MQRHFAPGSPISKITGTRRSPWWVCTAPTSGGSTWRRRRTGSTTEGCPSTRYSELFLDRTVTAECLPPAPAGPDLGTVGTVMFPVDRTNFFRDLHVSGRPLLMPDPLGYRQLSLIHISEPTRPY